MARGGGVRIPVIVDASGAQRGVRDVDAALRRMNDNAEGRFKKFGAAAKAAAVGGVAVLGAATVKFGIDSVKAAQESEASMARVQKMVTAAGVSWEKHAAQIDKAAAAAARKGFDDEKAAESIGRLTQQTKDVNEAIRLNSLAMDVARGRNISLEQATQIVTKANMGQAGAIRRLGIDVDKTATSQQLLASLQQRFSGQADAYSKTAAGAGDRLRVAWENVQESIGQRVMPVLARMLQKLADFANWLEANWPRIWADVRKHAEPVLSWIGGFAKNVFGVVKNAIQLVVNILQGDWGEAWGNIKGVVSNALSGLGKLAGLAAKAGLDLGKKFAGGIWDALVEVLDRLKSKFSSWINDIKGQISSLNPFSGSDWTGEAVARAQSAARSSGAFAGANVRRAVGGFIPGNPATGDSVPAMLTPGEVVLNRRQQALVGADRIMGVLASTGGVVGGTRFARGGVAAALSFAQAQLGEPYVWGGGHEGVTERRGWDCSGFASNVAARIPGYTGGIGTTMTLYPRSKPARGDEPVVFGFLGMNQSNPARQHMGIRINGQWFEAAGGGRGVIRGRSSWSSGLRVPPGLEYLSAAGGSLGAALGSDPGPSAAPDRPTGPVGVGAGLQAVARALNGDKPAAATRDVGRGASNAGFAASMSAAQRILSDPSLSTQQKLDRIAEEQDDARRNAEISYWTDVKNGATDRRAKLVKQLAKVNADIAKVAAKVPAKGAARQDALAQLAKLRSARKDLQVMIAGQNQVLEEAATALAELGREAQIDALDDQLDAMRSEANAAAATTSVAADVATDPNLQAQLDQANRRAEVAQAGQTAAAQFIRTALGPGDLGAGARSAWGAIQINVQSLHPGDPNVLRQIGDAVTRALAGAGLTPATAVSVGL